MQTSVSRNTILISTMILGASLFTVPFLHEYIQQSICSIEGVSNSMYYYRDVYPTAACSAERTWDDLFELSGGLVLGFAFLGFFALSLSQRWKIGILSSLPIASFQFMEAYIASSKGFMYVSFPDLVPVTWVIISTIVFVTMLYVLPRISNVQFPSLRNFSIFYLVIMGTVIVGLIMHNVFLPEDVDTWKAVAIGTAVNAILYVASRPKNNPSENILSVNNKSKRTDFQMYS